MMNATFPQVRIVPVRMLKPDTAERLLNMLAEISGIRRMMIHGPDADTTLIGLADPRNEDGPVFVRAER